MLSMPNWGSLFFLERGFTDAFLQSIHLLTFNNQSDEIIRIINTIFDKAITVGPEEATATGTSDVEPEQPAKTINPNSRTTSERAVREHYINASREWSIWTSAINATKNLSEGRE